MDTTVLREGQTQNPHMILAMSVPVAMCWVLYLRRTIYITHSYLLGSLQSLPIHISSVTLALV